MKRLGFFVVALCLVLTPLAKADSITLASHTGDNYTYNLNLDSNFNLFLPGGFALTGLTGVTNAYLSGTLDNIFDIAFDSSHVLVATLAGASFNFHAPYTIGTLTLTSTAYPGMVNFDILDSNGYFHGHVSGPAVDVAPTPEPSSLLLLATGLLGAAGIAKRKFAS